MKNIKYSTILGFLFVILLLPMIAYGQYYIIEDIPNTGDDGMMLEEEITTEENSPSQQVVEDTTTKIITDVITTTEKTTIVEDVVENKKTFQMASLLGTISGATLVVASTAIPLFATTPTMIQDLLFLNLFGFLSRKKNERRWGIVFDSDTKLPIPAAKITLFDEGMKEMETTYSDKDGRFGFLAGAGSYKIDVYKKNYELFTDKNYDDIYGNIYDNGVITVTDDQVLRVNIALHAPNMNWAEYADKKVKAYTGTWSLVKKYLFTSLYIIGFIATIIITIFYPSIINISLVVINIVFFMFIFLFKKRKDHGQVVATDKTPIPFAVVNLYNQETGKKDKFAVTDVIGRYYMLADNGKYTIKATGQLPGEQVQVVQNNVYVQDGLVDKDIVFKK